MPIYAGTILELPDTKFMSIFLTILLSASISPCILNCFLSSSVISSSVIFGFAFNTGSIKLKYNAPAGVTSSFSQAASKYVNNWSCKPAYTSFRFIFFIDDL